MCNSCRKKLQICPVCKAKLRTNRNLMAEKILEILPIKCCFTEHGCKEQLAKAEREKHILRCPFREVQCPDLSCSKKLSIPKLLEHVEVHALVKGKFPGRFKSYLTLKDGVFDVKAEKVSYWRTGHIRFMKDNFFVIVRRDPAAADW